MYTLCLDMSEFHCLFVGMGKVGTRKLTRLLAASPASVLVIDPQPLSSEALRLCESACVRYEARTFVEADLDSCFFVVAATDMICVNQEIARLCRSKNILCNCVTTPHEGNVIVPAIVEHKGITCAITTQGKSPALAKFLRKELQVWFEEKASPLPVCMARLRPHVLQAFQDEEMLYRRQKVFHDLVNSDFAMRLQAGDRAGCVVLLQALLPPSLYAIIDEVLYELV